MKLGKKPARIDANRLMLAKYLPAALPPAPAEADWTGGITDFGMMLNDNEGDCVFAAGGHAIQTWTKVLGVQRTPTDDQIQSYYEGWAGYRPGDPSTDDGYVIVDFLNKWRSFGYCGAILDGYADPDWNNLDHIKLSIALFGGVCIGVQIAQREMDQWNAGEPWISTQRGSEGHALWLPKYDGQWLYCVTWGRLQPMSPDFFVSHCDEAHTLRSPLFLNAQGEAASNVDLAAWDADLELISS
jgi:hypothetical protein